MTMLRILFAGAALLSATSIAAGEGAQTLPETRDTVRVVGSDGTERTVAPPVLTDAERYCAAIVDPARDARTLHQTEQLQALEAQIDARIDELEAKRAEYQEWLDRREAFLDSTSPIVLDIYAAMRPEAAAAQLSGLDRETAAAIIAKLKSRQASAILTEMPAPVAAEVAALIVARTHPGTNALSSVAEARS